MTAAMWMYGSPDLDAQTRPLHICSHFVQDCEDIIINRMYSAAPSEVEPLRPQASSDSLPNKQKPPRHRSSLLL